MNAMRTISRCVMGSALGSMLGLLSLFAGEHAQGIGLAIIGGLLGFLLALAPVLYRTTAPQAFLNGLLLFFQMTLEKNLGAGGLLPVEDGASPHRRAVLQADPVLLETRKNRGTIVGATVVCVPAVIAALYLPLDQEQPPLVWEILMRGAAAIALTFLVGGYLGAVIGALTLPGIHRRNISIGTAAGILFGFGVSTAIAPGSKVPMWQLYSSICALLGFFGMHFGMIADATPGIERRSPNEFDSQEKLANS